MNRLCRFATVAAVAIAASTCVTEACANPFAWFGFGYVPTDNGNQARADLQRRVVEYPGDETPGTIIVDTANTYLYYVLSGGRAIRYGIGRGREGLGWSGVETAERQSRAERSPDFASLNPGYDQCHCPALAAAESPRPSPGPRPSDTSCAPHRYPQQSQRHRSSRARADRKSRPSPAQQWHRRPARRAGVPRARSPDRPHRRIAHLVAGAA